MIRPALLTLLIAVTVMDAAEPILAVREISHRRSVLGSDSASYVVYSDGAVIFLRTSDNGKTPFGKRVVSAPDQAVQEALGFDIKQLAGDYTLTSATSQITTTIWTPAGKIWIYGNWRKPLLDDDSAIAQRELKMWQTLPTEIRDSLARIEKSRADQADDWLPDEIEVMLWPYEYAPEDSITWPDGWSDLNATTTRKRHSESYSVFLPSRLLPDLRQFISTRKQKGAVLINGKKMAISYRFPIPQEHHWMPRP